MVRYSSAASEVQVERLMPLSWCPDSCPRAVMALTPTWSPQHHSHKTVNRLHHFSDMAQKTISTCHLWMHLVKVEILRDIHCNYEAVMEYVTVLIPHPILWHNNINDPHQGVTPLIHFHLVLPCSRGSRPLELLHPLLCPALFAGEYFYLALKNNNIGNFKPLSIWRCPNRLNNLLLWLFSSMWHALALSWQVGGIWIWFTKLSLYGGEFFLLIYRVLI